MPFTTDQITRGADYALKTFAKKDPIDQINNEHVLLDWLLKNKEVSMFGNGSWKEPLHIANGSNFQNYFGPDQVTFNERDPAVWTDFSYYNAHDGFWFDEDRLAAAGIIITSDSGEVPSGAEKESLVNLLGQSYTGMKAGWNASLAMEVLRDGSQSTKAVPGMASIVDPTPAVGTCGGLNAATYAWWQNNANLTFSAANIVTEMEETWRDCRRYGGSVPDFLVCGAAFYDAYKQYAGQTVNRQINDGGNAKGGVSLDASVENLYFHGRLLVWDPDFEALDTLLSTTTQTKTCYFLNSKHIKFRPFKGRWMIDRKPERLPDRYVHYFGRTASYGLTTNKRNALAVLSIS